MTTSLQQYAEGWTPPPTTQSDHLDEARARRLADILDAPGLIDSGELPATWQWGYFSDWPDSASLNADGHPVDGPFQPPIPERRRMWAGGSVESIAPLILDAEVQREGSLRSVAAKSGRSGEMLLVGVQYDYLQGGELRLREVQNHVYRSGADQGTPRSWPARPTEHVQTAAPWRHDIATDPVRLFRFSALTANSHRIHYDRPYAIDIEDYPDLVVHGPLLAQQLAILGRRADPDLHLARFDYRVMSPVFVADAITATGGPDGELAVVSTGDRVHVSATASYRRAA